MRVVLDTNVLLAGVATHGLCESVISLTLRDHTLVLSDHILSEFEEHYVDKFKATADEANIAGRTLRSQSQIVEPTTVPPDACDDPDDLQILGTADAAAADYLVTGDQGLLQLGTYMGIPIVTPRVFYDLVRDRS